MLTGHSYAQSNKGFKGKEFWVTFTSNVITQNDTNLHLVLVASTDDTVTIKNPITNVTRVFVVKANKPKRAYLDKRQWQCWNNLDQPVAGPQPTAARITSKRDIQVFANNPVSISNDNTSLLPVEYLEFGQDYIINSKEADKGRGGQVAIVALDPGTTNVRIKTKVNLQGSLGLNFVEPIDFGHAFMVGTAEDKGSLAGTSIQVEGSCKRVAVFTSIRCAENGNSPSCSSCDLMMEQVWPTLYFEKEYVIPSVPDNNGYNIQLTAKYDNTDIFFDGALLVTLQSNETYDHDVLGTAEHYVNSSNPIGIVQMTKSYGCAGHPQGFGDPSLLNLSSSKNGVKDAYLGVYDDALYTHYAKVVVKSNTSPVILINGTTMVPVGGYKSYNFGGQSYYVGYTNLAPRNSYHFTSDKEFQGYYYGMGDKQGIATCFAAAFVNRNSDFTLSPSYVCDTFERFGFTAFGDSVSNIQWQFGDGNTSSSNPVNHQYASPGKYNVKLLSFRTSAFCKADTIEKEVSVFRRPEPVLPIDTMPCIGTVYKITLPDINGASYKWANGSISKERTFLNSEKIKLFITDSNNCRTEDSLSITFKECNFQTLKLANVFTPNKDGKNDRWRVVNEGFEVVDVYIHNRWGQLMYHYDATKEEHWNGTLGNKGFTECPDGVYFYQIVALNKFKGAEKIASGSVRIIR